MAEVIINKSSYRNIFKATSLFGGLQIYLILIGVIKSKVIAVLLGTTGMGLQGLYQATIDLVRSLTALGLEQSAVRDISEAHGSDDSKRIARTLTIVHRLVWLTGLLGLVMAVLLAPLLSRVTFGNEDYTWGFAILSITLLVNQLCAGQKVLLQGMRRLKDLAKASAIGSTIGLLICVPLYKLFGADGIVPTMLITSISAMLISWHFSKKIKIEKTVISIQAAVREGQTMIKMGVAMSASSILVTLFAYILRWYIRTQGGMSEVGLYTAGFVILNTYVGMIFTAMSTDYYPRLASVNNDNEQCRIVINQQGEIALLLLAPIIISCILFIPYIIRLVYSEEFLPAQNYILIAVVGMMFKVASWVISYSFLAKAESRLFIVNEFIASSYCLMLNMIGYRLGGLTGLGLSYLITYFVYFVQVFVIAKKRYDFRFSSSFVKIYGVQLVIVFLSFAIMKLWLSSWAYLPSSILFVCCCAFSFFELDKRLKFMEQLKK